MLRILRREGANVQGLGTLFKAVDQGVLLFGFKTWVNNPLMCRDYIGFKQSILGSLCLNPPNLPGNVIFQPISPLLDTQLQRTQQLHFTSHSPIDQTLSLEESVYLIFNTFFHLIYHTTNIIGTKCCRCVTNFSLCLGPVLGVFAGTREERIFNLFVHFNNNLVLRNIINVNLLLHHFQTLELENKANEQPINHQIKQPNILPKEIT